MKNKLLKFCFVSSLILSKPLTKLVKVLKSQSNRDRVVSGNVHYANFRIALFQFRKENEVSIDRVVKDYYLNRDTFPFYLLKTILRII